MRNKNIIIIFLTILVVILTLLLVIIISNIISNLIPYECDIGKPEIVGDYKYKESIFLMQEFHSCAIEDCSAFNKLNTEYRCVV